MRALGAAGGSRLETLAGLGVSPVEVCPAADPEDRVHAVRQTTPMTVFDARRCATGLARPSASRHRWSPALKSFSGPRHAVELHAAADPGLVALSTTLWCAVERARPAPR